MIWVFNFTANKKNNRNEKQIEFNSLSCTYKNVATVTISKVFFFLSLYMFEIFLNANIYLYDCVKYCTHCVCINVYITLLIFIVFVSNGNKYTLTNIIEKYLSKGLIDIYTTLIKLHHLFYTYLILLFFFTILICKLLVKNRCQSGLE